MLERLLPLVLPCQYNRSSAPAAVLYPAKPGRIKKRGGEILVENSDRIGHVVTCPGQSGTQVRFPAVVFLRSGFAVGILEVSSLPVTLRNQNVSRQTLSLTDQAWYALLDLAEAYGWRPLASVMPGECDWLELETPAYDPTGMAGLAARRNGNGSHEDPAENDEHEAQPGDARLVILEDALNLADALERAFMDYEPARVPVSFYLFEPDDRELRNRPAIGVITATMEFCRQGAFWIRSYQLP